MGVPLCVISHRKLSQETGCDQSANRGSLMEKTRTNTFVEEVSAVPGGEGVRLCIQCGTCTASCPSATRWEYTPSGVIAMIRAGMRDEVLSSSSMWHCLSCYFCTVRCPRNVKPTELFHILEGLASQYGFKAKETPTPAMYRSFVSSIQGNGRVHEFGMMLRFYWSIKFHLLTNPLATVKMLPLALRLFLHGRMPLIPKKVKGKDDLSRIIQKFREVRGY